MSRRSADHPSLEINPNAVKRRNSDAAKKLIDSVDSKPKDVYEAIVRAVKSGALELEERKKANGTGTYEVLISSYGDDDQEVPF